MKYKPETPEQAMARAKGQAGRIQKHAAERLDAAVAASLKRHGGQEQLEAYAALKEAFLAGESGSVEQASVFKKSVTGHVIPKSEREQLELYARTLSGLRDQKEPQIKRVETNYYQNSVRMGQKYEKDGGYWDSSVEMTARAFACYIKDKLPYQSDYLAGHADCAAAIASSGDGKTEVLKAFPEGEERKAIHAVFDEIIQDLKQRQILTHKEAVLPYPEQTVDRNGPAIQRKSRRSR